MFCPRCGNRIPEGAQQCSACGQLPAIGVPPVASTRIPNYLVQSILATLFCCLPLGIPAIVYAAQVDSKVAGGDLAGAMNSSSQAKKYCWISFGLGLAIYGLYVTFYLLMIIAAGAGEL